MNEAFTVRWATKKGWLPMPEGFAQLFGDDEVEVALLLKDSTGKSYPVSYSRPKNAIAAQGLMSFIRDHDVRAGQTIAIELTDPKSRIFTVSYVSDSEPDTGLYLGKAKDEMNRQLTDRKFYLDPEDLLRHIFICGVTGSGKTILGKAIIEEAALEGIPAIIVDLKGDLSSLPLIFPALKHENLEPWVEVRRGQNKAQIVGGIIEQYKENMAEFDLSHEHMVKLQERISFAVFTPLCGPAIPIAVSSPLEAPPDIDYLIKNDRPFMLNMISSFTGSFVKILFPEKKMGRLNKYKTLIAELVRYCWEKGERLEGQGGLQKILRYIQEPPREIEVIGGMAIYEFISARQLNELASRIAMCLAGSEQLWFQGVPLNIDKLLSRPYKDRTSVSIINLAELPSFDDQMHALSHLTYSIYNWMRLQGDCGGQPRLIFFIDEIGGGGGKQAFFPSLPYDPPSKAGINLLLRRGRAFGVCCLFATQNPGDVDYKGLSNCGTWAIGELRTDRDRKKVEEGMSAGDIYIQRVRDRLRSLQEKEFLVTKLDRTVTFIQERWILSYHKVLSESELAHVNDSDIRKHFSKFTSS